MKQLIFTIGLLSATTHLHGQYFEHRYGMPISVERTGSGQFTTYTGKGHIISAHRERYPISELLLIRSEQNGRIVPGPYFKNRYNLVDANGTIADVKSTRVAEFSNNTYGVVGVCETFNPSQQHVYYSSFDANGVPLFTNIYDLPNTVVSYTVNAIREGLSGNDLYLCGMVFDGIQHYALVMRIDATNGALIWGISYMIDSNVLSGEPEEAFDLIEFNNELLVVGQRHVCSSTSDDGFVLHLDPTNGNINGLTNFYGTNTDADSFRAITTDGNNTEYFVSGWSGASVTNRDHWVLSLDNSNAVLWSDLIDYDNWSGVGTGQDNHGIDLLKRVDYSGNPYIYSMGRTDVGELGQDDIEIYKIDALTGTVLSQITEGYFKNEMPSNIDQYNINSTEDGLAVYSTREYSGGNHDVMLHKTYFNGVTALGPGATCDFDIYSPTYTAGPGHLYDVQSYIIDYLTETSITAQYIDTLLDQEICHANSVTGGTNALQQNNFGSTVDVTISQINETAAILSVSAEQSQMMLVELHDMKGALLRSYGTVTLDQGETHIPIDLSGLQLMTGVYFIQWNNGFETGTQKILLR